VFGRVSYYWEEDLRELMSVVVPIVFNFSFFCKVYLVLQMMMSIGKEHVLLLHQFKKCNCLVQHTIALIVLSSCIRRPPPLMGMKKKSGGLQEKSSNPNYAQ
jgi:hypothetical protein